MERPGNVINVIYNNYPCVGKFVDDNGVILATTVEACELILRSKRWIDYLREINSPLIKNKEYKDSIQKYDAIIPTDVEFLSTIHIIEDKLTQHKYINTDDKNAVIELARSLGIAMKGSIRRLKDDTIKSLLQRIKKEIVIKGFKVSAVTMLHKDADIRDTFRKFLHTYLAQTCYMYPEDIKMNENYKEIIRLTGEQDIFSDMNIGPGYINALIDDNLAISFPGLYKNSEGKVVKVDIGDDLVSYKTVEWDKRPEFPKYAMIWVLRKSDYLVTNFISAKRGFDTREGVPDRDVYGQLICSNRSIRSTGMGKLLLVATILMAYQYKVNYVFIQAFQGVLGPQSPLYNRMGFNFDFSEELLCRKTAFYQWSLLDENEVDLDKLHQKYIEERPSRSVLRNILDTEFLSKKAKHLTFLQPMWLNVKEYDTRYACNLLITSGFDYHTKTVGPMGRSRSWFDIPLRALGLGGATTDSDSTPPPIPMDEERRRDGEHCNEDSQCLSDFCVVNRCTPYPYEIEESSTLRAIDSELSRKGHNVKEFAQQFKQRRELEMKLLADIDDKIEKAKTKEEIATAEKHLTELINTQKRHAKLSPQQEAEFSKRLQEYKQLGTKDKLKKIFYLFVKGLFGK